MDPRVFVSADPRGARRAETRRRAGDEALGAILAGIDIGGTKIATSVGDASGSVSWRTQRPTQASGRPREDVDRLIADLHEGLAAAGHAPDDLAAIGVSAPGPLDAAGRRLLTPPNLPWEDVPLVDWLEDAFDCPVAMENDANAAALAEWRHGAGRGFSSVVYLTMSTGVGGGLVLDGRLYRGVSHAAGEVGHARVAWGEDAELCGCGRRGCLEAYVGGASWTRRLRKVTPDESRVGVLAGGREHVRPEHVVEAAGEGDAFALREIERFNEYLARGITNLGFVLAPEVVLLGTIARAAGERLCLEPVRARVRESLWPVIAERMQILPAALGDDLPALAALAVAVEAAA